jgi:phosphocarrier protein
MARLSRREIGISNPSGFHLRAASRFVQLAQQFQANARVSCNGRTADGRSILDLTTLAAECGAQLTLEVTGPDAEAAAAALGALIQEGFDDKQDGWGERRGSSRSSGDGSSVTSQPTPQSKDSV